MNRHRVDMRARSQGEEEESLDGRFRIVAEAFLELFELLEEYAPVWYGEGHHNRALAAYRILQKFRGGGNVTMCSLPQ
jgi:hypothetical protein